MFSFAAVSKQMQNLRSSVKKVQVIPICHHRANVWKKTQTVTKMSDEGKLVRDHQGSCHELETYIIQISLSTVMQVLHPLGLSGC